MKRKQKNLTFNQKIKKTAKYEQYFVLFQYLHTCIILVLTELLLVSGTKTLTSYVEHLLECTIHYLHLFQ